MGECSAAPAVGDARPPVFSGCSAGNEGAGAVSRGGEDEAVAAPAAAERGVDGLSSLPLAGCAGSLAVASAEGADGEAGGGGGGTLAEPAAVVEGGGVAAYRSATRLGL